MACEGTSDDQIGEALLIGVVTNQVQKVTKDVSSLPLPKTKPITNAQDENLLKQMAETIRVIGDHLDQDPRYNDMIDGIARVADRSIFTKLADGVFSDGNINWGRIIVLFHSVGKLSAKMVLACLPSVLSDILSSSLEFFRKKLLHWICNMGGWISSISAVTQFSIERFSASSFRSIPPSAGLGLVFIAGALLGGIIVWRINRLK